MVIFALNYDNCRYVACCERVYACREIKKNHAGSFFLSDTVHISPYGDSPRKSPDEVTLHRGIYIRGESHMGAYGGVPQFISRTN